MKRLNPETGLLFRHGDVRDDGYQFVQYKSYKLKNGFFAEQWTNQNSFKKLSKNKVNYEKTYLKTKNGRAKYLLNSARKRTKQITIDYDWVLERLEKGVCELTGLNFDFNPSTNTQINPYAPSLDRIDSSNPEYSPENTRVVLSSVNFALNQFGLETMKPIFKELAKL